MSDTTHTKASTSVQRQVKAATNEAVLAVGVTAVVCLWEEWDLDRPQGMVAALALPLAQGFAIHGIQNSVGLGQWRWIYLPLRVATVALGVVYEYSHWAGFIGADAPAFITGPQALAAVALMYPLMTLTAVIAHRAHSTRLVVTEDLESERVEPSLRRPVPTPDSSDGTPGNVGGLGVPSPDSSTGPVVPANGPVEADRQTEDAWIARALELWAGTEAPSYGKVRAALKEELNGSTPSESTFYRKLKPHVAALNEKTTP